MTKLLAALVAGTMVAATPPVRAEEHLVTSPEAQERLVDAATARERDLAALTALVDSAQATAALAATGLDAARLRASLSALDDEELREIASRVAALDRDPVAGAAFTGKQVGLVAGLILIIVFVIIIA
jgi:hypothetical protein